MKATNQRSLEILGNTEGVISYTVGGLFNERIVVKMKNEYVIFKLMENLTDAGIYGKNAQMSFNYGYDKDGIYLAVYDVVYAK